MNLKALLRGCMGNWLNSLQLFKPQAFKLFLLVTLKAYGMALKHILYTFWWFLPIVAFLAVVSVTNFATDYAILYGLLIALITACAFFILFLTIRPSVARKDYSYYSSYIPAIIFMLVAYYIGYLIIVSGMLFAFVYLVPSSQMVIRFILRYALLLNPEVILSPLLLLILFFYMDSSKTIKAFLISIKNAFVFLGRNYPLVILSTFAFGILLKGAMLGLMGVMSYLPLPLLAKHIVLVTITAGFWYPFILAYYNTLYIKRVYDQLKVYI